MTRESSERSERDGPVPAVPSRPKARHSHYARRRRRAKPEGRRTEGRDRAAGLAVHDGRRKRAGPLRRGLRSGPIEGHGAGTRGRWKGPVGKEMTLDQKEAYSLVVPSISTRFSSRSVIPRLRSSSRHSVRTAKRRLRRVRSGETE